MSVILGLDLSLNAAAAVAVPANWDRVWSRVNTVVVGEVLSTMATLEERARRTQSIARKLCAFARQHNVTHAWIEDYAFSRKSASVHALAELGGVVKLALAEEGIVLERANMGTARKLLLGMGRGKGIKLAVYDAWLAAGRRFESLDESDAMACANLGLSHLGGYFFGQEEAA